MKILFLTEYNKIGGGEANLISLSRELCLNHSVKVICPLGSLSEALRRSGIQVIPLNMIIKKRWIKWMPFPVSAPGLSTCLEEADIIHCYSINTLPLVAKFSHKTIITIHGYWESPFGKRGKNIEKMCQKVLPVSKDVESICTITPSKIKQVYLGTKILPLNNQFIPTKQICDKVNLLCIGRFQHIKGQDLLVHAIKSVANHLPDKTINLTFIGPPSSSSNKDIKFHHQVTLEAQKEIPRNLKITFHDFQNNIKEFIKKAHLTIVPSRYESFSMVSVESLSCLTPVIIPDIGGVKEIVNSNRIGLKFLPDNTQSLKNTIIKGIENYQSFIPQECYERAQNFSIEKQAKQIEKIYTEVTDECATNT